eukprot:COSAG05_NODE_2548_length_2915_cov_2.008523_1_plen_32_part_10
MVAIYTVYGDGKLVWLLTSVLFLMSLLAGQML